LAAGDDPDGRILRVPAPTYHCVADRVRCSPWRFVRRISPPFGGSDFCCWPPKNPAARAAFLRTKNEGRLLLTDSINHADRRQGTVLGAIPLPCFEIKSNGETRRAFPRRFLPRHRVHFMAARASQIRAYAILGIGSGGLEPAFELRRRSPSGRERQMYEQGFWLGCGARSRDCISHLAKH